MRSKLIATARDVDDGGAADLMRLAPERLKETKTMSNFSPSGRPHRARRAGRADARHRQQPGERQHHRASSATAPTSRRWPIRTIAVAGRARSGETTYATGLNLGTGVGRPVDRPDRPPRARSRPPATRSTSRSTATAISRSRCPDGTLGYTRAGNFRRSSEGQIVTTARLCRCMPEIQIPDGATLDHDRRPTAPSRRRSPARASRPRSARSRSPSFTNPAGLQALGDNFLRRDRRQRRGAGRPRRREGRGSIRQGTLEGSNVNVVEELVDMIECQRAYEVNSKMISATDEMLRNANQTL